MYTKFYKAYSSQRESHNAIVGAGQRSQEVQSNQRSMEDLIQINTEAKDCIRELTQRVDKLEGKIESMEKQLQDLRNDAPNEEQPDDEVSSGLSTPPPSFEDTQVEEPASAQPSKRMRVR